MRLTACCRPVMLWRKKAAPEKGKNPPPAEIGGVRVRPSARARRLALRVEARSGEVVLTWPRHGVSQKSALRFVEQNEGWIARHRQKHAPRRPLAAGDKISVLGQDCVIEHKPGRGVTRLENGILTVHGRPEHLPRRVRDFLKVEALRVLSSSLTEKSALLDLKPSAVRIADPRTRWGSCGPDGKIMFSWRLLLAPPAVMDYVVAHEVAHRIHLNHSQKFWALCFSLCAEGAKSRRWLKDNGAELMRL